MTDPSDKMRRDRRRLTHKRNVRAAEAEVVKAAEAVFVTYEAKELVGLPEIRLHDAVLQLRAVRDEPV